MRDCFAKKLSRKEIGEKFIHIRGMNLDSQEKREIIAFLEITAPTLDLYLSGKGKEYTKSICIIDVCECILNNRSSKK